MLKPIPARILTHDAVLQQCSGIDIWGKPTYMDLPLANICIQPTHETRMTKENTEVVLNSVAFIDARISQPANVDYMLMQSVSEQNGAPLNIVYNGKTYVVVNVDALCDDTGKLHHTELGLK